jgi:hypothetical protein
VNLTMAVARALPALSMATTRTVCKPFGNRRADPPSALGVHRTGEVVRPVSCDELEGVPGVASHHVVDVRLEVGARQGHRSRGDVGLRHTGGGKDGEQACEGEDPWWSHVPAIGGSAESVDPQTITRYPFRVSIGYCLGNAAGPAYGRGWATNTGGNECV